jgi:hypothetical protein
MLRSAEDRVEVERDGTQLRRRLPQERADEQQLVETRPRV